MYIAVLGVTLFVSLVGVGALYQVETERQRRVSTDESRRARLDARSALQIMLERIASDPDWRSAYEPGVWTSTQGMGETKWAALLEYDDDADADASIPVTITVGARRSESARYYAIDALVSAGESSESTLNLISNSEFESGVDPWEARNCTLKIDSSRAHSGSASLGVIDRSAQAYSSYAHYDLKDVLEQGKTYDASLYIYASSSLSVIMELEIISSNGTSFSSTTATTSAGKWVEISKSFTANWYGTPTSAYFAVYPKTSLSDFWIDDVRFEDPDGEVTIGLPSVELMEASFRQRTLD